MSRKPIFFSIVFAAIPSVALANPSPVAGPYGIFIGLFAEAVLIAVILGCKGFDPVRFFYSWGVVTCVTFAGLAGAILLVDKLWMTKQFASMEIEIWLFVLLEAIVVWVEAIILRRMTHLEFFKRTAADSISFQQALGYSLIVNVVSVLFGV